MLLANAVRGCEPPLVAWSVREHQRAALVDRLLVVAEAGYDGRDVPADQGVVALESRPIRGAPWEYLFYVEVEANREDLTFGRALTHLAEFARWTRVLGTYKGAERRASEQAASTNPMP